MSKKLLNLIASGFAVISLAITSLGQTLDLTPAMPRPSSKIEAANVLRNMSSLLQAETADLYSTEVKKIASVLAKPSQKNPILIDQTGNDRELIVQAAASRLASQPPVKNIYTIDWTSIFSTATSDADVEGTVAAIISHASSSKGKVVLYLDDVSAFSKDRPLLGKRIATQIYNAIADGKIQVITGTNAENFDSQIASDASLKKRFTRIDIDEDDPFVGDKLSPDLRALVADAADDKIIKVILQADDINNVGLRRVLDANNIRIDARADGLEMLVLDLPVRIAEAVSQARGVKHLSLDRELKTLGHIEKTTGASIARTIHQGLNVSLLGTGVLNTSSELDGAGIGIAIVDSSIRENHRSFVSTSGAKRVVQRANFTTDSRVDYDEFGHGTHVASLAAGNNGANLNLSDGNFISPYEGVASGSKIINIRVLDDYGVGTTARLISALNWILANRAANNIRVVNLSLGAPAVETWRNDPLCRAVRQLTAVGIVVVAAAGNNGKNAAGQKLYGAIHSPGNDPTVITVGAANTFGTDARNDDGVTTYSSRGPTRSYWTDPAGVKHFDHLIKPDIVAPGNWIIGARAAGNEIINGNEDLGVNNNADDTRKMMYMSGTSMATPIVSGTAALMLQANPKLKPNMIKMILQYTAQPLDGFNTLEQGAGLLNIEGATRLSYLIRQNLPNPTPQDEPMLTTSTLPAHSSTISGTKFQWAGGMFPSYAAVTGTALIT
ncbi:MAG: S8 family serine peptidase, partial [Blastocatellia bacterium]|nr:S8 family serine peptidase [Blastocatellia bacterium]